VSKKEDDKLNINNNDGLKTDEIDLGDIDLDNIDDINLDDIGDMDEAEFISPSQKSELDSDIGLDEDDDELTVILDDEVDIDEIGNDDVSTLDVSSDDDLNVNDINVDDFDMDSIDLDDDASSSSSSSSSGSIHDTKSEEDFDNLLNDEISLNDMDDEEIGATTLDEISLDDITSGNAVDEATSTLIDVDTGVTEELDLNLDSDDDLFPDDTDGTEAVTGDFDFEDAITGEIPTTDPIDVTADLDISGDTLVGAAGVGSAISVMQKVTVKNSLDLWPILLLPAVIALMYTSTTIWSNAYDFIPVSMKEVKDMPQFINKGSFKSTKKLEN